MLRLLNLGSQASGSSKAPVEHWEMFCLLLSLEVGTSFCSEAEALPCPVPVTPSKVSNREHIDKPSDPKWGLETVAATVLAHQSCH